MGDWTPQERRIRTPYGIIRYGGPCEDHYSNFVTYDQGGGHTVFTLQRPAMKALWAAQVRYARKSGWSKERLEENPKGRPISVLPGTNRSCETQTRLWREDPNRYANPKYTGHTRGLALDLNLNQGNARDRDNLKEALRAEGWHWARPDDEPWHCSFHLTI